MPEQLTVAVAQPECRPDDLVGNVGRPVDAVRRSAARLVVFPEMSLTGYDLGALDVDPASPALAPLVDACWAFGATALVGAPVSEPAGRFIATLVVDAEGVRVAYRKAFPGAQELEAFSAGPGPAAIEVDGWRVGLGICRDTRIAEHLDDTVALGIDLYVAGLVHGDDEVEELTTRAVRIAALGGVPVAFASAAGWSGPAYPSCVGHSAIWDRTGRLMSTAGPSIDEIATASLGDGDRDDHVR